MWAVNDGGATVRSLATADETTSSSCIFLSTTDHSNEAEEQDRCGGRHCTSTSTTAISTVATVLL